MTVESTFTKPPNNAFDKSAPYETDEGLLKQLEILELFKDPITHPVLDEIEAKMYSQEGLAELNAKDPNLMVFYNEIKIIEKEEDPSPYKDAFINILKLRLVLYATNGWFRTHIGFDIWAIACAADPNSYFQLAWEDHFEPRRFYRPGEKWRDCPLFRATKSDIQFAIPDVKIDGYKEIE